MQHQCCRGMVLWRSQDFPSLGQPQVEVKLKDQCELSAVSANHMDSCDYGNKKPIGIQ